MHAPELQHAARTSSAQSTLVLLYFLDSSLLGSGSAQPWPARQPPAQTRLVGGVIKRDWLQAQCRLMDSEQPAPRTAGARPYLRRGAGWETRVQAAREGRRYRPKGGPVLNYTDPVAAPTRRSPSKASGAAAKPRNRPLAKALASGAALAQAGKGVAGRRAAATPPWPAGTNPSGPQPHQSSAQAALPPLQAQASQAGTAPPLAASALTTWGPQEADEELELKEFCALESEVLREVSNITQRGSQRSGQRNAQPRAVDGTDSVPDADQCSAAFNWPGPQWHPEQGEEEEEEDVFQSDGECGARYTFQPVQPKAARGKSVSFAESSAPASSAIVEEGEGEELAAQSELLEEVPLKPTSTLVQKLFYSQKLERPPPPPEEKAPADLLQKQAEELEQQVKKLSEARVKVARQRRQVEDAKARLEQDKAAFETRKADELAQVEAMKAEELRKLQRDRRVLEQQSRALLKLPTKREKEEIQALEAVLEKERQNAKGKDARHKLTVDRLRRQILELQEKNNELREQVQYLEAQRLHQWGGSEQGTLSPAKRSGAPLPVQHSQGAKKPLPCAGSDSSRGFAASPCQQQVEKSAGGQAAYSTDDGSHGPVRAAGAAHPDAVSFDDYDSEFEDGGHVLTEELDEEATFVSALPTVRVSVHKAQPGVQQAALQQAAPPLPLRLPGDQAMPAAATSHRVSLEESTQPATAAVKVAAVTAAGPAWPAAGGVVGGAAAQEADVMSKASTALHRFNQLKESLVQPSSLQQKVSSRLSSLQATPAAAPALAPVVAAAAEAPAGDSRMASAGGGSAATQDALRQLGRMLTSCSNHPAASLHAASVSFAMQQPAAQQQAGTAPSVATAAAGPAIRSEPQQAATEAAAATAAGGPSAMHENGVVSARQYDDGHVERVYASGLRLQQFPNGSAKRHWPDGRTATCFGNGDIKKTWPDGRVEYYYDAVGCWHVTYPNNCEVFHFPSGQVEAHHPGGVKEILFPDGIVKKILPDGRELAITVMHLSWEIQLPRPKSSFEY